MLGPQKSKHFLASQAIVPSSPDVLLGPGQSEKYKSTKEYSHQDE